MQFVTATAVLGAGVSGGELDRAFLFGVFERVAAGIFGRGLHVTLFY